MGEGKKDKVEREFSAGGVVFKRQNDKLSWLLINPAGTDRWQFPKGHLDEGESSRKAATREVFEETGIEAKLVSQIGKSQYFFVLDGGRIFKIVTFFLMEYLSGKIKKPDIEVAEAGFFPYEKAHKMLTFKDDKKMLEKANGTLSQGIQGNLI